MPAAEPLQVEVQAFVDAIRERRAPVASGEEGLAVVEVLDALQRSMDEGGVPIALDPEPASRAGRAPCARTCVLGDGVELGEGVEIGANVVIHAGTRVGDGCAHRRRRGARQAAQPGPPLDRRARRCRRLVVGDGATISTNAVVYAGVELGAGAIVGDLAERPRALHRSAPTRSSAAASASRTTRASARASSIQSNAYITAYCTLEDDVFIAPCVSPRTTTSWAAPRSATSSIKGATIRRGARVGGASCLLPGIEIGEEAFVAAGALVPATCRRGRS